MSQSPSQNPSQTPSQAPSGLDAYLDVEEREQKIQKGSLKRLIVLILAQKWLFLSGLLLITLGTSATVALPWLFGHAVDAAIVPRDWPLLQKLTALYLLVEMTRVLSVIGHAYLFEKLGQNVMQSLRLSLFGHLQRLPVSVYDKNPVGRLVTRVTNDIAALAEMFSSGFVAVIGNVGMVVGILGWLFYLDSRLAWIVCTVLPPLVWLSVVSSAKLRIAYRNARSKLSALNAFLAENILGMRVVNLFNRQKLQLSRFEHVNQWFTDAQIGSVRVFAVLQPAITLAGGTAVALAIYFGGARAQDGTLKIGVLIAFFSYVMALFQPLREISEKWNIFLSGMASAERIFAILDWPTELDERAIAGPPVINEEIRGEIRFENVWFAYNDPVDGSEPHWVLKDFSLIVPAGTRVGFVGHTGAGKTTVISLLLRFYQPQKGRILLDGRDLREYDLRTLRAAIGIVQQDVFLFSGSVRDNWTLWREPGPGIEKEVRETLGKLGLASKEDLELDERGGNLSMGERQVLAFTRALAANPPIWILDEATANIDSGTEQEIDRALERNAVGRTLLMVAHRLATVREAEQIVVLHKGQIVERGRHEELMRLNGLYARLFRYQAALETSSG